MKTPALVYNATKAMAAICRFCDDHLVKHYDAIHAQFVPLLPSIAMKERGTILEGLARLISRLHYDAACRTLQELTRPIFQEVTEQLAAVARDEEAIHASLVDCLNLLASLCASCKFDDVTMDNWDRLLQGEVQSPHPLILTFQGLWKQIVSIQQRFPRDLQIAELLERLVRNMIIATGVHFIVLSQDTTQLTMNTLKVRSHSISFQVVPTH